MTFSPSIQEESAPLSPPARITYCYLCKGERGPILYDAPYPHPLGFTLDHVIARSRFDHLPEDQRRTALLDETNVKPTHKVCNESKQDDPPPMDALRPNPGMKWGS